MSRAWLFPIIIAAAAAVLTAMVGATMTTLDPWYENLVKPGWAPPDGAYGIVWTLIFAVTALAAVTGWRAMPNSREGDTLIGLFALNGFLNILWSLIFFRLHRPDWALAEVLALWLSVGALILYSWRRSMLAATLLTPYLLWVTFAGYLNMQIVHLNHPFG
jgi:tryptophan-rich sensory protein